MRKLKKMDLLLNPLTVLISNCFLILLPVVISIYIVDIITDKLSNLFVQTKVRSELDFEPKMVQNTV